MENWKEIKEGGYEVSNLGKVRNKKTKRVIKAHANHRGYLRVKLAMNKKSINFTIHRLVAETFLTNPFDKPQVDHINRIKDDNRLINLRFATQLENMANREIKGIVNNELIREIISLHENGCNVDEIYKKLN